MTGIPQRNSRRNKVNNLYLCTNNTNTGGDGISQQGLQEGTGSVRIPEDIKTVLRFPRGGEQPSNCGLSVYWARTLVCFVFVGFFPAT